MIKVCIKVMVLAIIAMGITLPLTAQTWPPALDVYQNIGELESNTSRATAGLFGSRIDDYMSYHSYAGVDIDSWMGFIHGGWAGEGVDTGDPTFRLSAGFARNFGNLYLGIWYQGNIIQSTDGLFNNSFSNKQVSVTKIPEWNDVSQTLTQTTTITEYLERDLASTNQLEFLIGIAGQGIRVGFYESFMSNMNEGKPTAYDDSTGKPENATIVIDHQNGHIEYTRAIDEYTKQKGYIRPYLGWGSNFNVAGFALRPFVNAGFEFYIDKEIDNYSNYEQINGRKTQLESIIGDGYNNGYVMPYGNVGVEVDLPAKEGSTATAGILYGLETKIYNNTYATADLGGNTVNGTVSWGPRPPAGSPPPPPTPIAGHLNWKQDFIDRTETRTDIALDITEIVDMTHTIIPSFRLISGDIRGVQLGFGIGLPVKINTYSTNCYTDTYDYQETVYKADGRKEITDERTTDYGNWEEFTTLNIAMELAVGVSYQLIDDRFNINAGISLRPTAFTSETYRNKARSVQTVKKTKTTTLAGDVFEDKVVTPVTSGGAVNDIGAVVNEWQPFSGNICGGFVFYFNSDMTLDLAAGLNTNNFAIDAARLDVMLTVKF